LAARGWSSGCDAARCRRITAIEGGGDDHGDHGRTGGMTDTDARADRANGTALGNKVGQPIVDTRMMVMFDRTAIRLVFDFTRLLEAV
jgi:hypothetical protein